MDSLGDTIRKLREDKELPLRAFAALNRTHTNRKAPPHMKFTLSWLKDHLDTTAAIDEICEGLVGVGLEVEEVSDMTKALAPFKVGYVLEAETAGSARTSRSCC